MKGSILFITASDLSNYQSASTRIWNISKVLNEHGISTKIIGKKSGWNGNIEGHNIIAIKPLFKGFFGELLFRLQLSISTIRVLFSEDMSCAILRGSDSILIAFLLRIIGKKVIYDFHGYRYKEQGLENRLIRSKITLIFESIILLIPNKIISVSDGVSRQLPKKYKRKTIILPNGVDQELFKRNNDDEIDFKTFEKYKLPSNKRIVGFIGMWGSNMNIKDILDTSMYCNNIQILIVGNGYGSKDLLAYTKFNNAITWTGKVSHEESIKLLKLIDICITPYSKDIYCANESGFFEARKNKEYLAAGKPIIMSNIKGKENFLESENALFYEPGNPRDLAKKIQLLLEDESLRKKIGENNKNLSKEFSWKRLVQKSGLINHIGI